MQRACVVAKAILLCCKGYFVVAKADLQRSFCVCKGYFVLQRLFCFCKGYLCCAKAILLLHKLFKEQFVCAKAVVFCFAKADLQRSFLCAKAMFVAEAIFFAKAD